MKTERHFKLKIKELASQILRFLRGRGLNFDNSLILGANKDFLTTICFCYSTYTNFVQEWAQMFKYIKQYPNCKD